MDAAAELGKNEVTKHHVQPENGDNRPTRDGTAEPVSRNHIFRCERGQGSIVVPWTAGHEQDWQDTSYQDLN